MSDTPNLDDPKAIAALTKFYEQELSAAAQARDAALPPDGTLSDDGVQQAADLADGVDDGIAARPSTDLGNALFDYEAKKIDLLELYSIAFRDGFTKGDRRPTAGDVLKFLEITGTTIAQAAAKIAALAALLPK